MIRALADCPGTKLRAGHVEVVSAIADVKSWFDGASDGLSQHSKASAFRVTYAGTPKRIQLEFKASADGDWYSIRETGSVRFFKGAPSTSRPAPCKLVPCYKNAEELATCERNLLEKLYDAVDTSDFDMAYAWRWRWARATWARFFELQRNLSESHPTALEKWTLFDRGNYPDVAPAPAARTSTRPLAQPLVVSAGLGRANDAAPEVACAKVGDLAIVGRVTDDYPFWLVKILAISGDGENIRGRAYITTGTGPKRWEGPWVPAFVDDDADSSGSDSSDDLTLAQLVVTPRPPAAKEPRRGRPARRGGRGGAAAERRPYTVEFDVRNLQVWGFALTKADKLRQKTLADLRGRPDIKDF